MGRGGGPALSLQAQFMSVVWAASQGLVQVHGPSAAGGWVHGP